jgi:hypothetical protein
LLYQGERADGIDSCSFDSAFLLLLVKSWLSTTISILHVNE